MQKNIIGIFLGAAALGIVLLLAGGDVSGVSSGSSQNGTGSLTVVDSNYFDFGTISMSSGVVSHKFVLKNVGASPVVIRKFYTSCMCTSATLQIAGERFGPFGMRGHGIIPRVDQTLDLGDEAIVDVVFDPAAHGPAGVGQVNRVVTIENDANNPVELKFHAIVTP
ncbi:MAG: hypothetical protein COU07_01080 [Candidatus Harrisonbacteria bacterium CG10_big_fil_rev_8_21_14_0_10_40_38]|uniref:DUF1573 domain-containing protein n=1 Tax=Candidatus Harrisonbacteria bacterium CG10_big_fil_rev_8_21_14_0_10_40_38 TaxID=1974583 RepID=A0A2H0USV9_9BACT|nr:MAG: hypothetical protein COU07_01080 [Candidatus Harrisonbacteria bacterium CG10_big_fil_rev_8_21_14_0_10_40_38]